MLVSRFGTLLTMLFVKVLVLSLTAFVGAAGNFLDRFSGSDIGSLLSMCLDGAC